MKRGLVLLLLLAVAPAAGAQPATLFPGALDLPVKAGHAVADCSALAPEDPDDPGPPDITGMACISPGTEGGRPGLQHYMTALRDKGFALQPSNLQTPVFYFCRGEELVLLSTMRPQIVMNEDLDYIDEDGKPTTFEAIMAKAPLVLLHKPQGPCSYL